MLDLGSTELAEVALGRETQQHLPPKAATPFFGLETACWNIDGPANGVRGGGALAYSSKRLRPSRMA